MLACGRKKSILYLYQKLGQLSIYLPRDSAAYTVYIITHLIFVVLKARDIRHLNELDLATKSSHRRRRCEHGTDVVLLKDAIIRTRIWSSNRLTLQNT